MEQDIQQKYLSCKMENEELKWSINNLLERNAMMLSLIKRGEFDIELWTANCDGEETISIKKFTSLESFDKALNQIKQDLRHPFGYRVINYD